ncbi:MAG: hypothetical protein M3230_01215 [Thermoproteota archaeon]|nr:hypothetical protein [Thermoproteota archaeon]
MYVENTKQRQITVKLARCNLQAVNIRTIAAKKMKPYNCLSCRILAKNIKRVADHACDIIDKELKPKYKISSA